MRTGLYQNYKNGYALLVGSLEKNNKLQNNIRKLRPLISNDTKQPNKQVRSINHKIIPPIPLEDLYKRKGTAITRFFQNNSNKIEQSNTYNTDRNNIKCQHKSIQVSQVNEIIMEIDNTSSTYSNIQAIELLSLAIIITVYLKVYQLPKVKKIQWK